jgi:hypothetical protein
VVSWSLLELPLLDLSQLKLAMSMTSEEFDKFLRGDIAKWAGGLEPVLVGERNCAQNSGAKRCVEISSLIMVGSSFSIA